MRILSITAGAAGMYCGSCARDNAFARELIAQGHDVNLVPVYTPTRTDEPNASRDKVLFGGISVYLQQYVPLFRWTPRVLDRLWDSPRIINRFAGRAVSNDPGLLGNLTVSMLAGTDGALRKEFEKLLAWLRTEPPPDIINIPNSLVISLAKPLREAFGVPITCTLQGEELFIEGLVAPYREKTLSRIRELAPLVDKFVAVSRYEAAFMAGYLGIDRDRIEVVPLGINMEGYERSRRVGGPFRVGYLARTAPEKGLRELAAAYIRLRKRTRGSDLRLEAAGYTSPDHRGYLAEVRSQLRDAGLEDEFEHHGAVDRDGKLGFLKSLDVLSVPATYDEPKGLFLIEAMASGVPVVQPRRGAFVEVVESTGGGILVEPDNVDSLTEGLFEIWKDPEKRIALGDAAYAGVRRHYSIEGATRRLVEVFEIALAEREARSETGPAPQERLR